MPIILEMNYVPNLQDKIASYSEMRLKYALIFLLAFTSIQNQQRPNGFMSYEEDLGIPISWPETKQASSKVVQYFRPATIGEILPLAEIGAGLEEAIASASADPEHADDDPKDMTLKEVKDYQVKIPRSKLRLLKIYDFFYRRLAV